MKTLPSRQTIDISGSGRPLDRYFLEGIGSCHAYLTLREDWRDHARLIQREIGFGSVRCHAIFLDLVGICPAKGVYNFTNLDKIYDFWLSIGLKPYVELSFMPEALASGTQTIFRYKGNVTPPVDMEDWSDLIRAFLQHLIERYGLNEVLTWNFEVWNEPDLEGGFWVGGQEKYFELYAAAARTIKSVDPRLKVGGPSTSKSAWVQETLDYCIANQVPIDFLSTHHYCADASLVMGKYTDGISWRGQKAMREDVQHTRSTLQRSRLRGLELHYTEWNVSPAHQDSYGKDSEFTAAFVLQTLKDIEGLADRYMLWAISDIFEESGPGDAPFSGKYGLVNIHGIPKPVYHAYRFLSRLYDEVLPGGESMVVTRSWQGGHLRLLTWNYNEAIQIDLTGGDYQLDESTKEESLRVAPLYGRYRLRGWRVDRENGNAYRAWQAMGSPQYPTAAQVEALRGAAEPVLFDDRVIDCASALELTHSLPPNGMIYYEIDRLS
jgi:xylan 1,4-beta-xylosidase